jgi:hypothetical protein
MSASIETMKEAKAKADVRPSIQMDVTVKTTPIVSVSDALTDIELKEFMAEWRARNMPLYRYLPY